MAASPPRSPRRTSATNSSSSSSGDPSPPLSCSCSRAPPGPPAASQTGPPSGRGPQHQRCRGGFRGGSCPQMRAPLTRRCRAFSSPWLGRRDPSGSGGAPPGPPPSSPGPAGSSPPRGGFSSSSMGRRRPRLLRSLRWGAAPRGARRVAPPTGGEDPRPAALPGDTACPAALPHGAPPLQPHHTPPTQSRPAASPCPSRIPQPRCPWACTFLFCLISDTRALLSPASFLPSHFH